MICLRESKDGVLLSVHAQPGASRSAIKGLHGDALKVAVHAPPVDGAANEALRELLCELFSLSRSCVELKAGPTARRKVFLLRSITIEQASKLLEVALQ